MVQCGPVVLLGCSSILAGLLPGLPGFAGWSCWRCCVAVRRIADPHLGEGKTDARDAYIIADAARTMPHSLRRVGTDEETLAGLTVLAGYDDDLAAQSTRLTNRLRDAAPARASGTGTPCWASTSDADDLRAPFAAAGSAGAACPLAGRMYRPRALYRIPMPVQSGGS